MNIIILWASLADYTVTCFSALAKTPGVKMRIVYQSANPEAPYQRFDLSAFEATLADESEEATLKWCSVEWCDAIIMASWNYPHYMHIAKQARANGRYVVSVFDRQWQGTLRQRLGTIVSRFFLKPAIDNVLVPGDRHVDFAVRLGFKNPWQGYCCANIERFMGDCGQGQTQSAPAFLYVGRLSPEKGIHLLLAAYRAYRERAVAPWALRIVGAGSLYDVCASETGVEMCGFKQPTELPQMFLSSRALIFPSTSRYDGWGLVVHEAAAAGLPIICTHACAASTWFVRHGLNGAIVNATSRDLSHAMFQLTQLNREAFAEMSEVSRSLASVWTPQRWSAIVHRMLCEGIAERRGARWSARE